MSARRKWVAAAAAVLALGAAFLAGYLIERGARQGAEARVAAAETQLQQAQGQVAAAQARNRLLAANVAVFRAAAALDNRNFGVANDLMNAVRSNLQQVEAAAAPGLDPAALAAVRERANAVQVSVATDFEAQRDELLGLAADINTLVGPAA